MSINMQTKEPGLTSEVYQAIQEAEPLLKSPRQVFQAHEMAQMYKIYNGYTGQNKQDGGCGACRTSVMNKVRKIYDEYKKTL
jgi:hypothetical protein